VSAHSQLINIIVVVVVIIVIVIIIKLSSTVLVHAVSSLFTSHKRNA